MVQHLKYRKKFFKDFLNSAKKSNRFTLYLKRIGFKIESNLYKNMKKTIKIIVLGIGIIAVILVLFFIGFLIKTKSETKNMTAIETKEIVENIFSVYEPFTNMFLIKDSDQYIAIDAGNKVNKVEKELKKLSIDPNKVIAVFLTHTDHDHVAALSLFGNAKVFISEQEEQMINGEKLRLFIFRNKIDTTNYEVIKDQEVLNVGNISIQGILTPGHTPGSMCYLINSKYLFTGDALSLKTGKINKFNEFFNMDTKTAVHSMEKLLKLPEAEYIFTAHYGYSDNYKNAIKDWEK